MLFFTRILTIIMVIICVAHLGACNWFMLGHVGITTDPENPRGWLVSFYNLMNEDDLKNVGLSQLYLNSFYWSVTTVTTIGYGDLSPKSRSEILFVIFYMIAAGFVFAFVMGQMGDIISAYYEAGKAQEDYMKGL